MIASTTEAGLAFYGALGAIEGIIKGESADTGRYVIRFASLNAVLAECERACQLFGLEVSQEPTVHEGLFAVKTSLVHKDGGKVTFDPMCLPMPKEAQALGSATTYLRRYSLVSIFGIPVEDDDGKAATVAAQVQPGRRTEAERMIRERIATMTARERAQFMEDFKTEFGVGLSDLAANRHGDALTWTREWTPAAPDNEGKDDQKQEGAGSE